MTHFRKSGRFIVRDSYVVLPQQLLLNYVVKFKVCILIIKANEMHYFSAFSAHHQES